MKVRITVLIVPRACCPAKEISFGEVKKNLSPRGDLNSYLVSGVRKCIHVYPRTVFLEQAPSRLILNLVLFTFQHQQILSVAVNVEHAQHCVTYRTIAN